MTKKILTLYIAALITSSALAQRVNSIKINEVMTNNQSNIRDEYGEHLPWIEIVNTSYSSYEIRGMFITTDTAVLNKKLSAPQRIKRMSIIPNSQYAKLTARQHVLFFLNSSRNKGPQHIEASINPQRNNWIAIYDGNGVDLVDSVTIPILKNNKSYARLHDGEPKWVVKNEDATTPATRNHILSSDNKISRLKQDDPHGFGITILSMGIVFTCLALLYLAFTIMGAIMKRRKRKKEEWRKTKHSRKFHLKRNALPTEINTSTIEPEATETPDETTLEEYLAVIAMALKEYEDNSHDSESGIITIKYSNRHWRNV